MQHVQVIIFQSTHVLWRWELSASTTPFFPKFCVPLLGSLKLYAQHFWSILTTFSAILLLPFCNITYQCLRNELAKTEHAINLPPSLQKCLYASKVPGTWYIQGILVAEYRYCSEYLRVSHRMIPVYRYCCSLAKT